MADNSSAFRLFWHDIDDVETARDATKVGAYGAWIVALFSAGLLAFLKFRGNPIAPSALWIGAIMSAIFAILGFGTWRNSRVCAVIAVALYVLDRLSAALFAGVGGASVVGIAVLLLLISGVRGTFSQRRYSSATPDNMSDA
jgi:hypothetical protein